MGDDGHSDIEQKIKEMPYFDQLVFHNAKNSSQP